MIRGNAEKPAAPKDGRLAGLDAVRFAAAMMVVATHYGIPMPFGPWGGNGVSLFFALSGYLLWRPFVTGRPDTRRYLVARGARILPAYWLACVVLVVIFGSAPAWAWFAMVPGVDAPLGVVWTLQAEVAFYLALPLLGLLRRPLAVPIVLGAASLALELLLASTPLHAAAAESMLPVRFWAFSGGMIVAASGVRPGRWTIALGLALMCVGAAVNEQVGGQWTNIPTMLGATFIVAGGVAAAPPLAALWSAGAAVSFGLYLWHVDLRTLLGWLGLPATFVVAAASYRYLEAPVMRWSRAQVGDRKLRREAPRLQRLNGPRVALDPGLDVIGGDQRIHR